MNIKKVDVIESIASFTGLKIDVVKLFLDAYRLSILNSVLESQFEEDELDRIDLDIFTIEFKDYPKVNIQFDEDFTEKINATIKGRDFLSESVISKFNKELIDRFTNGEDDPLFDHEPSLFEEADIHDEQ
jgi:hypothetical protein